MPPNYPNDILEPLTLDPLVCVVLNDVAGNVVHFNEMAERAFGFKSFEVVGKSVLSLFECSSLEKLNRANSVPARRKDGSTFVVVPITFRALTNDGQVLIRRMFRDHSSRQKLEEDLRQGRAFALALQEIAVASNEAASIEVALTVIMKAIARYSGAVFGSVEMIEETEVGPRGKDHRSEDSFYLADQHGWAAFDEIRRTMPRAFGGVGLRGQALATHQIAWSGNLRDLPTEEQTRLSEALGAKTAFALPVISTGKPLAVMVFLSRSSEPQDSRLAELSQFVGNQLARVVERKTFESELIRAREAAIDASSAKSRFLANMSHEFRTPLNAITGMAHLLMRTHLDDEQEEYARTMVRSADALLALINDVLDFSKIEAGKLDLKLSDFQLDTLFNDTAAIMAYDAVQKGISLETFIDPDVPLSVRGDAGRIRQVLVNLIGNAVKFTERGKVAVSVRRQSSGPGRVQVRFEVEDTGIGIATEALGRIFQVFSQLDSSTTRKHPGTGLGLSISRKLVEMMGGVIAVESEEGKGSTFWFTVGLQTVDAGRASQETSRASARSAPLEGRRVLVAEDNLIAQKMVVRMLQQLGYETLAANNGREAVDAAAAGLCDLVLMDCQMPELDGLEATRRIRGASGKTATLPIVAMTANALKGDRERCLQAGMDDYISKPIDPDLLSALIGEFLAPAEVHLDRAMLGRLRALNRQGEPDVVRELADLFFETSPGRLERIRESFQSRNLDQLAREAHSLGSAAASLGATGLFSSCQELDALGRSGDLAPAGRVIERLERGYQLFVKHLHRELSCASN